MKQGQAIRTNSGDALVERMYQDYHAGHDCVVGMVVLRWADGHQTTHTAMELRQAGEADNLYVLPLCSSANQTSVPFCELPWAERVKMAHQYFPAALSLATALGPLWQGNDDNAAALGSAFANYTLRKNEWCDCGRAEENGNSQFYWCNEQGRHGWACRKCCGVTQVG